MAVVPFRAPARRRLHEDVAEQLRDAILDGRFDAGTKLPPERELAAEFRVNRTSVREAIKVLEGLGLVTVRPGGPLRGHPRALRPARRHDAESGLAAPRPAAARALPAAPHGGGARAAAAGSRPPRTAHRRLPRRPRSATDRRSRRHSPAAHP